MTTQLERATRENRVLQRIIEALYSGEDVDAVLPSIVALVTEATVCDACFLHLYDAAEGCLVLRAASEPYVEAVGRVRLALGEGVAGWVAMHRAPTVICDDKWSDPRYRYLPELGGERYTSMASVPLVSPRGKLVGAVNIHTEARREFEDDDVAFLERVATLVAAAIEHVELFRELASTERALQALMTRSVQAQEEERRRLAAEIHDGVTQHLVSAWYRVHGAQRRFSSDPALAAADLAEAKRLIDEALAEARTAIHALRPGMLDDLGLVPSLEALARTATEAGVPAEIDARLDTPLPEHLELAVYRIVQEALTNVRKHACASRVEVRLRCEGAAVELSVSDDGVGFDVERYRLAHSQTSFGLAGISERVELVGGSLDVTSEPGAGTTVRVRVPLERAEART